MRVTLLDIGIDPITLSEAVSRIRVFLTSNKQHHVMTPNSEMLVEASINPAFHALLNRSALNLPDSTGLLWAARHTGQHLPERVTGVDTVEAVCRDITEEHPVFFLGAGEGVAAKAAVIFRSQHPHLRIAGTFAGSPKESDAAEIIACINDTKPHLLFVAYGAPTQDEWIDRYLRQMPSVRVAMGVGGTFDFIAGVQKRAPKMFQMLGIEWLWRLIWEPRRWRRIVTAVVVFPWMVLRRQSEKFKVKSEK